MTLFDAGLKKFVVQWDNAVVQDHEQSNVNLVIGSNLVSRYNYLFSLQMVPSLFSAFYLKTAQLSCCTNRLSCLKSNAPVMRFFLDCHATVMGHSHPDLHDLKF
jgi:hypothetical protein